MDAGRGQRSFAAAAAGDRQKGTDVSGGRKSFLRDILVVEAGNLFVLLSSVLVGLVVPKLMGIVNYGYYQIFTLYMTYTSLLHAGFIDGVLLVHGGESYDEIDKERFRLNTRFFTAFQAVVSLLVIAAACLFMKGIYRYIFIMVGADTLVVNVTKYFQFVSQCTMRFREWSLRKVIQAGLKISIVLLFILLHRMGRIDELSCLSFTAAVVVIDTLLLLWYISTYREITFGESLPLRGNWSGLTIYFRLGIMLTIAYEVSTLILSLDRQFVSILFDTGTYGIYSFAYRMVYMVTTVVTAVSTVLFPTLKRKTKEQVIGAFDSTMALISIVVFAAMAGYYPLCLFIRYFLGEYAQSLVYFRILFPGIALTSCITAIIFNYYKVLNRNGLYFVICCLVLGFAAVSNYTFYLIMKTPAAFSIASIITLFVWYLGAEWYLVRKYRVKWVRNLAYICLMTALFYVITAVFPDSLWGMLLYAAVFAAGTAALMRDVLAKYLRIPGIGKRR